jgi:hypothetical protein
MLTVKGGKSMKKRKGIRSILLLAVLAVAALALALVPTSARAQDYDADGFWGTDDEGALIPWGTVAPGYDVYPTHPDLFVIFQTWPVGSSPLVTTTSVQDKLDLIALDYGNHGLDVTVHVIDDHVSQSTHPDRLILESPSVPQHGVRLTENTVTSTGNILGQCQDGTPNDEDDCQYWPLRVENIIKKACGNNPEWRNDPDCKDEDGNTGDDLLDRYLEWVVLHEVGHSITLARCDRTEYNGRHYAPGSGWIMDQSVLYESRQGGKLIIFSFPDMFNPESQDAFDLVAETDTATCEAIEEGKGKKK